MKNILYLIVVGVVVWVAYATFFGTNEDKEKRDRLFSGLKTTAQAVSEIVSSEKGKISEGKYDKAIDLVTNTLQSLKTAEKETGTNYQQQISELEATNKDLKKQKEQLAVSESRAAEPVKPLAKNKKVVEYNDIPPTAADFENKMQRVKVILEQLQAAEPTK